MSSRSSASVGARTGRPAASLQAVVDHAWSVDAFTATDIMRETGLTRSTAIEATTALVERGLLAELEDARSVGEYRTGRPARRFGVRADAWVLVGIDTGNAHATVAIADLRSRLLHTARARFMPDVDDASARLQRILLLVDEALAAVGRGRDAVLAVCAGVAAPVDRHGRSPAHPDRFWERMNPNLIDALTWSPARRVVNDASLAAVAEGQLGSAVGVGNYVVLLAGARLGAGVVMDGTLLHGAHGGVGEMVAFDHVAGVGSADGLFARAASLARAGRPRGEIGHGRERSELAARDLDGMRVFRAAAAGDVAAASIVDELGLVLARIVDVLASMYDPEAIILAGSIAEFVAPVVDAARRAAPHARALPAPDVSVSHLGSDVVVLGAVAAAARDARERVLSVLFEQQ